MSKLLKSRDYLMKCLGFVLLLGFISLGAIVGCNDNGGGGSSQDTQALTENDFSSDPTLSADPEKHLIVHFLEHPDSEKPENDTGEVGVDIIPHTYTRTLNHTLCWEDDDADAEHFMVIEDSEGNEILRLDVNGECVTEVLEAGDYLMHIHHDGRIEKTHTIFIRPEPNGDLGAKKEETIPEGILERAGRVLSKILEKLDISITQTTNAQTPTSTPTPTVKDNIQTLLTTNKCVGCDLTRANLRGANLSGVDLRGANLTEAILIGVTVSESTNFTSATWCDGLCTCGANSFGLCAECASIDTCTGGGIPQKILDLLPIKGMAYQPTPSDFSPDCRDPASCKYFDTDFYNDDFKGLWSMNNPGGSGPGRGDLDIIAKELGVNFLHLYNWSSPPLRNHKNFLDYCSKLGIKVTLPISNFTLECIRGDQSCRDCCGDPLGISTLEFAKKNVKDILTEVITDGKPHEAIAMWLIGNEFDLNGFSADVVAKAIQFLLEAEQELGVTDDANKLPISSPISFAQSFCCSDSSGTNCESPLRGCNPQSTNCPVSPFTTCPSPTSSTLIPGEIAINSLTKAISENSVTAPILNTRFVPGLNTFNKANFMKTYLEMTFPEKFLKLGLWLPEYGFDSINAGLQNTTQEQIVKDQLDLCASLITISPPTTNPNGYFLGCTNFEWLDEVGKTETEAAFGAVKFDGTQIGIGMTTNIPTNGPETYPIDNLVDKPVFDSIMQAFMPLP